MVRGDPACRKEDCSQYDIGLVFKEISSYSDQDKFKFTENVWKPGELLTSQCQWKVRILTVILCGGG